jgi:hypothetical protein
MAGGPMQTDFLDAAFQLKDLANQALEANKAAEWVSLMELSFTSAAATVGSVPLSVKLHPKALLPFPLVATEHLLAQVSRRGIVVHAAIDLLAHPVADLRRFPLLGALLSEVAKEVPEAGLFQLVVDIGDGNDAGAYPRMAFSSARADTILVPDPYFFFNDNNAFYRAYATQQAKPWRDRRKAIFWRGGSAGPRLAKPDAQNPRNWSCQQRLHLCQAARDSAHRNRLDIALSHANTIGEAYLRDSLAQEGFLKPEVPKLEFFEYRHLVDVDGWTNAWSLLDKLIGGATILKVQSAGKYRQWFYDKLVPWRNYVPLAADLSDFDDIVAWVFAHPAECEDLAAAAASLGEDIQLMPDLAFSARAALAILSPVQQV